ncbi:MAG: replicative DNA helicase [Deltaproteobacteria bacterium]|jgi:replicative DNA helicase|nr:replicative DNA helicase [Deltaproteobacteria bacterium]
MSNNTAEILIENTTQDIQFPEQSAGRTPPHSLEAEQSVLGAVLRDNESLNYIIDGKLQADDFYKKAHKTIFTAMLKMNAKGEPIDTLTLANFLKKVDTTAEKGKNDNEFFSKADNLLQDVGGINYLITLLDSVPTSANAAYYTKIVKDSALRRKLIHAASEIVDSAFTHKGETLDLIDNIEEKILQISSVRTHNGVTKISDIMQNAFPRIEARYNNKGAITGVETGLTELDKLTSGFQPSDLIIIAGRPAMGKTALALSIVRKIAVEYGKRVAFFSLEMSADQIGDRILSIESRVSSSKIRSGYLATDDFARLADAGGRISPADIIIDETPSITVGELRAKARRIHRDKNLDIIFIDYLQLMRANPSRNDRNREQEVAEISRSLKALAKELRIPVVAMSQLSRAVEKRTTTGISDPLLSDLRESGAIEQDADIIAFVQRKYPITKKEEDRNEAKLIIAKHRNGETRTIPLIFHGEYTSFENAAEGYGEITEEAIISGVLSSSNLRGNNEEDSLYDEPIL